MTIPNQEKPDLYRQTLIYNSAREDESVQKPELSGLELSVRLALRRGIFSEHLQSFHENNRFSRLPQYLREVIGDSPYLDKRTARAEYLDTVYKSTFASSQRPSQQ